MKRSYLVLLLVIFGGIVLHAPFTVLLGTAFPSFSLLIKSWDEILMLIALILLLVQLHKLRRWKLLRDPFLIAIAIFAGLHFLLLPFLWQGLQPSLAGIEIDLRYLLFFVLVYLGLKLYPEWRHWFLRIAMVGALVVTVFGVLQVTVLPNDVLKYLSYNDSTIQPYLTVDKNPNYVRINSTLRGPNPVGAYAVIVLAGVLAYWLKGRLSKAGKAGQVEAAALAAGGLVCLWASYSRSAWLAGVVAAVTVLAVVYGRRLSRRVWVVIGGIVAVLAVITVVAVATPWGQTAISNVIFHKNPDGGSATTSDSGHATSLQTAWDSAVAHPLGSGVGSTGSASLLGNNMDIVENQFLFVAHEAGWLGLLLFALIWLGALSRLWQARSDWLALSVFASGLGLVVIGILLPVFTDDTIGIIWWGLAAIALATVRRRT